jgi:predicted nucleic acid-binding protein
MPAIVDSSGWIEYFIDGPNANCFAAAIENTDDLIVPSITLTEVYRWMLREATESEALAAVAVMKQGKVVPLDDQLSILAAELSHRHKLPLADGIIYTTAKHQNAELITQDADMEGLPGVTYIRHPERK